jgi:hypothetical protein
MCILGCILAGAITCMAAWAGDSGVPPRASAQDYPVQGQALTAKIAAVILPPNQVSKMFSADIAKDYVVVEVAIYPENGVPFDVQSSDFALRVGQKTGRADRPLDVAPWPERRDPVSRLPVDVTAETGVIYGRSNDPVNGPRQGVGTYSGVGVSAPARNDVPPPPDPRIDPRLVYDKVQRLALPEGTTKIAIAGYLYFPQYAKKKKSDEMELKYAKDADTVNLLLPIPSRR